MRFALALALLLAAPAYAGDLVMKIKESGIELRLYDAPCSHGGTLGLLKEEWRGKFRNARILNAKGFIEAYGCWLEKDGTAIVIFDDGSNATLKMSVFSDPTV